ncbi:MAG: hypothetical protein ACRDWE_07410, partial [Acidimicrobiales bacterium]
MHVAIEARQPRHLARTRIVDACGFVVGSAGGKSHATAQQVDTKIYVEGDIAVGPVAQGSKAPLDRILCVCAHDSVDVHGRIGKAQNGGAGERARRVLTRPSVVHKFVNHSGGDLKHGRDESRSSHRLNQAVIAHVADGDDGRSSKVERPLNSAGPCRGRRDRGAIQDDQRCVTSKEWFTDPRVEVDDGPVDVPGRATNQWVEGSGAREAVGAQRIAVAQPHPPSVLDAQGP